MNRTVLAAATAAFVAVAVPALSAGVLNDPIMKWQDDPSVNCKNADTTFAMNVCAGRDYKKTYLAMVKVYNALYAKYDAPNKKLLLASQAAWEKYMDAECTYETAGTQGGTINSTMQTNCDATLVALRTKQLTAQANCQEGDLSCNHP
jgi:uncharacterized protein YecT (DUF1311 family)